jgi:hypothetical protein
MTISHRNGAAVVTVAAVLLLSAGAAQAAVEISSKPTRDISCSDGTCTPNGKTGVLNVSDLAQMLASGDTKVVSTKQSLDIDIKAGLSWSSTHRLTLDAFRSIVFSKPVTVAGNGAVTLTTSDGGSQGDFSFAGKGQLEFWSSSSSLIINNRSYTLANSIAEIAAGFGGNSSALYALAKDYDASPDGTYTTSPIAAILNGTFEGLGNTISGFSLHLADHSTKGGLIACACPGSVVRDIVLKQANVQGADNADVVGALAGLAYGTVIGASVSGSVRGSGDPAANDSVGGLLGEAHSLVANSRSSAKVSDAATVGGLVGFLVDGGVGTPMVVNSSASGHLSGRSQIGGLIGQIGLTAHIEVVKDSFSTAIIDSASCDGCGGLAGGNTGSIVDSYAAGAVNAGSCGACGGLVGMNSGKISTSYSTAAITASGGFIGGLIGKDASSAGSLLDTYWDLETSGVTDPAIGAGNVSNDPGITGLSEAQLKATLPQGFDSHIWKQAPGVNGGYPYLLADPPE